MKKIQSSVQVLLITMKHNIYMWRWLTLCTQKVSALENNDKFPASISSLQFYDLLATNRSYEVLF